MTGRNAGGAGTDTDAADQADALADWVARLRAGNAVALARAITAVENEAASAASLVAAVRPFVGHALVCGITGPPGAGKSTVINALVQGWRGAGKQIGVIAVDPSSPLSGGAVLGDRVRMVAHGADSGVFVRSLASRGHLGGLSPMAAQVVDLMDASGKDVIILETVGAGQSEVEVAEIADIKVVVCAPGLGDDVQAIKAGILEIADILVVNKADQPLADRTMTQLKRMLMLRRGEAQNVPVLSTVATENAGIGDLIAAIEVSRNVDHISNRMARISARTQRLLAESAGRRLTDYIRQPGNRYFAALSAAVDGGELTITEASEQILAALTAGHGATNSDGQDRHRRTGRKAR